jgi:hypothetical protein
MTDQTYQVVFRGQIAPDTSVETVKANLAKLFKTDDAKIARLFTGRDAVLKKGLGQEEARRYQAFLAKAGALCDLVPALSVPPPPPVTKQSTSSAPPNPGHVDAAPSKVPGKGGAAPQTPPLKQRAAAMKDKVKGMRAGDLQQTLGAMRDKVQDMDAEEAGRRVSSFIEGVTARVKADVHKSGLAGRKKNKALWGLGAVLLAVMIALAVTFSGRPRPMPIESRDFEQFAKQYYREIHQSDLSHVSTSVLIQRAHDVLDDMGFDFNRTLLLWLLNKDQVESKGGAAIYRTILVEPVAVALAAGLSGIDTLIAPETRQVFETVATIPPGVDLKTIQMVKACPSESNLLRHDDLLQVLKDNSVVIETSPDLAIADTFFGLEQAGFVKIQRRWENDVQFADLEMLDRDAMNAVEAKLQHLDELKKQFRLIAKR